jgi:pimeloyl-ACP methyl ester carboxylesterase
MAAAHPKRVASVVLLSSFLGVTGPTSRWLVEWGSRILGLIPRDLRNAVREVSGQADQLSYMRAALNQLSVPVHVLHGDVDDFAPIEIAERLVAETRTRRPIHFERIAGVNHFLNDGPAETVIDRLEACIPKAEPIRLRLPRLPRINWRWAGFQPKVTHVRRPPQASVSPILLWKRRSDKAAGVLGFGVAPSGR